LQVPPLRERKEDIPLLADFFLNREKKKYNKDNLKISPAAMRRLQEYQWAGNIRELQHTIEKAVILSDSEELGTNDFLLSNNTRQDMNTIPTTIEEAEKFLIVASLNRNRGNYSLVAEELGITRPTLYSKVKKYGIL
jgi:DNA-binding NtrC family response regulator